MRYSIIVLVGIFFYGLTPELVTAQTVLAVDVREYSIGDLVGVTLAINTGTDAVNTIESKVVFSPDILEFVSSDNSDSVIDLWIENPRLFDNTHVYFAGLTPLGFTANQATVISLQFRVKQVGIAQVSIFEPTVLRNDGLGTKLRVTDQTFTLSVIDKANSGQGTTIDTELPEDFTPTLVSDPDFFAGQWVVVFSTRDTGSGISHYEVKEGHNGKYVRTDSPFVLQYQALNRVLYIKAVDNAGNERIKILYPQNWKPWYEPPEIIATIVVSCLFLAFLGWFWYLRRRR